MKLTTKKLNSNLFSPLLLIVAIITFWLYPASVLAADSLSGKLSIIYSESTGKLSVVYDGSCTLSGAETYTWYKDGTTIATGSSYAPTAAGTFYCILRDTNSFENSLTSSSITLFRVTGSGIEFDNMYGLYEAGDNVTVSATLNDGQSVSNWKTSATGVEIPQTGQTVSFRMPAQNVTVSNTVKSSYSIKVYGGTSDCYEAFGGDTVTITASNIDGKEFDSWSATGGRLGDASQKTTTLTLANSNVVVTAKFKDKTDKAPENTIANNKKADAKHVVYEILSNGGYSVQIKHHKQGSLCDAAFKNAQGQDWLVTDYFNITLNNSLAIYETKSPLKIRLNIPEDLITTGRKWKMVCVSKNGSVYSFEDEDTDDSTITFSPDKFYAYAMCYNDVVNESTEDISLEEPKNSESSEDDMLQKTELHSISDSKTNNSTIHSAESSVTSNNRNAKNAVEKNTKLKSDQTYSVERAHGSTVPLINM